MNEIEQSNLVDSICAKLESTWKSGSRTNLEELLDESLYASLSNNNSLVSVIQFEIELRRKHGEAPQAAEYAKRFPQISPDVIQDLLLCPVLPTFANEECLFPSRYQQMEMVGQGGIGQVWRVIDHHMDRALAIKVSRQRKQFVNLRLEREAKLTGALQHPGIPPVFDHGKLTDGSEYFSMKLVEGQTLENILQNRQADQDDLESLIGIFEQIAQTVAYAHSQNVIHRDLKPQNVMVGKFGEVQVMDWGMGKRLSDNGARTAQARIPASLDRAATDTVMSANDSSYVNAYEDPLKSLTQTGEIFGTPAYMAPEQARGEIDALGPQCDVFGLGAILFGILTGSRLYDNARADEVLLKAANGDLDESLRKLDEVNHDAELVQLCRDCLQPLAKDRPASGDDVARRITQYQIGVKSRLKQAELDQQAAEVRAAEERKRRKTATWLSAAVVAAISLGLIGVVWQWNKASQASELANIRLGETRTVVDEYFSIISEDGGLLAKNPGTQELRRTLLEKARDYYVKFVSDSNDDHDLRFDTAVAYSRLAKIANELDPGCDEIFAMREVEIQLLRELIDENKGEPVYEYWEHLADAQYDVALAYSGKSDSKKALEAYKKSEETILQWLLLFDTDHVKFQLAKNTKNMGTEYQRLGDHGEAMKKTLAALAQAEPILERSENLPEYMQDVAVMHLGLGVQYGWYQKEKRDWKLARDHTQIAIDLLEELIVIEPDKSRHKQNLVIALNNQGMIHYNLKLKGEPKAKRVERCRQAFDRAVQIGEKLVNENPGIPKYVDALANQLSNYATFLVYEGNKDGCLEKKLDSAKLYQQIALAHPQVQEYSEAAILQLDGFASMNGRSPESRAAIKDCLVVFRQLLGQTPIDTPDGQQNHMQFAIRAGVDSRDPSPELLEFTEYVEDAQKPTEDQVISRALALYRNDRFDDALQTLKRKKPKGRIIFHGLIGALANLKLENIDAADDLYKSAESELAKQKWSDRDYYELLLQDEYIELTK